MTNPHRAKPPELSPHSNEAEQTTLGAILMDNTLLTEIRAFLQPEDFFFLKHRWMYSAMLELQERGEPIDPLTVTEELRRAERQDEIPNCEYYLTQLPSYVHSAMYGAVYAHIVERAAYRRRVIDFAQDTAGLAWDEDRDTIEILNEIDAAWKVIRDGLTRDGARSAKDIASAVYDAVLEGNDMHVPTGYEDLDTQLSGGFRPGSVYDLCGRPGMGKTTFGVNVARNIAYREKLPVVFFSFEMTEEQLIEWMIAGQMKYPASDFWRIKKGDDPTLVKRFVDALDWVSKLPVYVNDNSHTTPAQMMAYINTLQRMHGRIGLVIIDHINRAETGLRDLDHSANSYGRVSHLAKEYKNLAKDADVPVLCLAQLNRAVEMRTDKRPMLSDLRESGRVEEEADVVLGMYRDGYYNSEAVDTMSTELLTLKNRQGPHGKVLVQALFKHSRFYNTLWRGDKPDGINWPTESRLDGGAESTANGRGTGAGTAGSGSNLANL